MKNFIILSLMIIFISSCSNIKRIGDLNMISNRNIDTKENYVLIERYVNDSKREIKKSKAKTIEEAIDKTVKNVNGGEFIKNAKIYMIQKKNKYYFAVEGDVWGVK